MSRSFDPCADHEKIMCDQCQFKDDLIRENERLKSENERLKKIESFYKELCKEWDEDCKDDCNSYAHNEECGNVSLAAAKRALKCENQKLKDEVEHLKDCESALGKLAIRHQKLKESAAFLARVLESVQLDLERNAKGLQPYGGFHTVQEEFSSINTEASRALKQYKEMMGE